MHIQVSKHVLFLHTAKAHIKMWCSESAKQMVIQVQVGDLSVCLPFWVCGEYRERLHLCVPPTALAWICFMALFFFFFLSDHRSVIKKDSFFPSSYSSHSLTNRPAVFKRYLQLCLQTKHERPTSKAAPINSGRTGATGQCWGAGEMSNKQRPSAFSCTVPTLERRPFNKQQRKQINLGAGPQYHYT